MKDKNTIVRFIRVAAGVGTALAPSLAAQWLERLFLTPRRWQTPDRELGWMAKGEGRTVPFDDDRELPLLSWGKGPTILLVHGWSGRGSQLGAFVKPLVEHGFRVVTFDAPSHGEADGRLSGLPEMATAIEIIARQVGPVLGVVAHSLGAAATTIALSRGLQAERVVYLAPPDDPGDYLFRAARLLGFGDDVAHLTQARIEGRFGFRFEDARGTALAKTLDVPLLVIHDQDDGEVPYEEGARLAQGWPDATLVTTHGLGHRRILRAPEAIDRAVRFLSSAGRSARPEPSHQEELVLPKGNRLYLRPLQPADKQELVHGLERMSPESRYSRFMGVRNGLSEQALRYLCEVDGYDHFAIGAAEKGPDGREQGVGVGRFVRLKDEPRVAEPAITVIDEYQGQGIGTILLERLAAAARERGIDRFRCELLTSNQNAQHLLHSFDNEATVKHLGEVMTMELDLHQPSRQRRAANGPEQAKPVPQPTRAPA